MNYDDTGNAEHPGSAMSMIDYFAISAQLSARLAQHLELTPHEVRALTSSHPHVMYAHPGVDDTTMAAYVRSAPHASKVIPVMQSWNPARSPELLATCMQRLVDLSPDIAGADRSYDMAAVWTYEAVADMADLGLLREVVPVQLRALFPMALAFLTAGDRDPDVLAAAGADARMRWLLGPHAQHLDQAAVTALVAADREDDTDESWWTHRVLLLAMYPHLEQSLDEKMPSPRLEQDMRGHGTAPCTTQCPYLVRHRYTSLTGVEFIAPLVRVAVAVDLSEHHAAQVWDMLTAVVSQSPFALPFTRDTDGESERPEDNDTLQRVGNGLLNVLAPRLGQLAGLQQITGLGAPMYGGPTGLAGLWVNPDALPDEPPWEEVPDPVNVLAAAVITPLVRSAPPELQLSMWGLIFDLTDTWNGSLADLVAAAHGIRSAAR